MQLRVAGLVNDSIVDGDGFRFTIFVQGCPHHCFGCHNPETWDENAGTWMETDDILQKILKNPLLSGVTFSGGEPFCQAESLCALAEKIREHHLNIWSYTGYTLEALLALSEKNPAIKKLLQLVDVLVDGPFILEERSLQLKFRGSKNQRVIDMNATRENNFQTIVKKYE